MERKENEGWSIDKRIPIGSILVVICIIGSMMAWYGNTSSLISSTLAEHRVRIEQLERNQQDQITILNKLNDKIDRLLEAKYANPRH